MFLNFSKRLVAGVAVLSVSAIALADEAAVKKKLAELLPNGANLPVVESPIPNLYQVTLGAKVVYVSGDGQYVINGNIVNLDTRENVTEKAVNDIRKQALAEVPVDSMIVYPAKGEMKHVITVFTDIDCPYCKKLHAEVPALNQAGIEVRYLAYPRAGIGSGSYQKAVSTWCSDKPTQAMDKTMTGGDIPAKSCANPILDHMQLVERFGVTGTPNIVFDSGQMIPGYAPAKELIKMLNAS